MTVAERVAAKLASERREAKAVLARILKERKRLSREYDKAWGAYMKTPDGSPDATAKGEAAEKASAILQRSFTQEAQARKRLALLNDPAEAARRVETNTKLAALKEDKMTKKDTTPKAEKAAPAEAPKALVNRIVKEINAGVGLSTLAKKLNDEGVPTLGRSSQWHPPTVRGIYLKETGLSGVKAARAENPLASKKVADQPARPATKVTREAPAEPIDVPAETPKEVTPDPKPTKKAASPRKRTVAKKTTAKAAA